MNRLDADLKVRLPEYLRNFTLPLAAGQQLTLGNRSSQRRILGREGSLVAHSSTASDLKVRLPEYLRNFTPPLAAGQQLTLGNRSSQRRILGREGSLVAHSSTASRMASCTRGRTWQMACDMRLGQVRLVSNVTESWRVGSIQTEVPVNPR